MAKGAEKAGLQVRVGRQTVDAADRAAVDAAVAAHNASVRIEGLEENLNPDLLDAAKVHAFLAAVAGLAAGKRRGFERNSMYLNAPGLALAPGAPSSVAGLAKLEAVAAGEVQGGTAFPLVTLAPDCGVARTQAGAAKAAFEGWGPEEARLEAARRTPGEGKSRVLHELAAVRSRRHAAARTWRENAVALEVCSPGSGAKAEVAAAEAAVGASSVPSGPGMR